MYYQALPHSVFPGNVDGTSGNNHPKQRQQYKTPAGKTGTLKNLPSYA
jgi:hypothetical protein